MKFVSTIVVILAALSCQFGEPLAAQEGAASEAAKSSTVLAPSQVSSGETSPKTQSPESQNLTGSNGQENPSVSVAPKSADEQAGKSGNADVIPDYVIRMESDSWNSLEIVKLVVGLLTPAAMLMIGLWMDRRIKEYEHRQWSNQKVIEKRLDVYERITPQLNELMCYFLQIGAWKRNDPRSIISMKRDIDKIAYIYAPLFSEQFLERYNGFMSVCFATFRGDGKDAQLRIEAQPYRDAFVGKDGCGTWDAAWDDCYTGKEEKSEEGDVRKAYRELVGLIARELGVGLESDHATPPPKPSKKKQAKANAAKGSAVTQPETSIQAEPETA